MLAAIVANIESVNAHSRQGSGMLYSFSLNKNEKGEVINRHCKQFRCRQSLLVFKDINLYGKTEFLPMEIISFILNQMKRD